MIAIFENDQPTLDKSVKPPDKKQRDPGRPDLYLQGVFVGSHEGLDPQVLLQETKELFNLPAVPVSGRDHDSP